MEKWSRFLAVWEMLIETKMINYLILTRIDKIKKANNSSFGEDGMAGAHQLLVGVCYVQCAMYLGKQFGYFL